MNKKIKAVVKNYEKHMKFESKFEQLSQKLDLIKDDTPPKSDVIVIRRRLIPAYLMSVLVIALVTGLIGLQIGLGNLKIKTEYVNPVEVELQKRVDLYLLQNVSTTILGDDLIINYYIGMKADKKYVIINLTTNANYGDVEISFGEATNTLNIEEDEFWAVFGVDEVSEYEFAFIYENSMNQSYSKIVNLELSEYFDYLENTN